MTAPCRATGGPHAMEVEWPEDAVMLGGGRRWMYRCQECGSVSDEPVPAHLRRYP